MPSVWWTKHYRPGLQLLTAVKELKKKSGNTIISTFLFPFPDSNSDSSLNSVNCSPPDIFTSSTPTPGHQGNYFLNPIFQEQESSDANFNSLAWDSFNLRRQQAHVTVDLRTEDTPQQAHVTIWKKWTSFVKKET